MAAFLLLTLFMTLPALSHAQNCVQWIKRTDVGSYGQRMHHAWVYSSDGVNGFWQQVTGTAAGRRAGLSMALGETPFLHGGVVSSRFNSFPSQSTYRWDGSAWSLAAENGPGIYGFGMAYDPFRAVLMTAGGFTQSVEGYPTDHFWEFNAASGWRDLGAAIPARGFPAMAFDERRRRFVVVGGTSLAGPGVGEEAYEYIPGTGWLIIPRLPSGQGRAGAKMVYDSKRGVMVLTGGAGGGAPNAEDGGRYSDTWELWPSLFVSGQPSDATNLTCSTATFSTFVQGAGPFQYNWRLDGAPLSDDAHFSGSHTAELRINGLRQAHAGKYDVVVRDSCVPQNVVTSKVATLTVRPGAEWVLRATDGPPARFHHTMVYDSARRVTVLFGGRTNWGTSYPLNDLWEWDGARWTQRMLATVTNGWTYTPAIGWQIAHRERPVQRAHHAMAYDSRRGRVVLFGGQALDPNGNTHNLNDLWEWDGWQWHFRATNGPVPRFYCSMAYDERRGRTVLFGGNSIPGAGESIDSELVWEWDGEQWHTITPPLNPSSSNYRAHSRMTYDSFRGVIVFGPTTENHSHWAFWDWDGAKWTIFPVVHFTDPIVTVLHGTSSGGFAFDANRRRSTWFGGIQVAPVNHTALFDGKGWTLLTDSMLFPAKRVLPAMAYDSDRHAHVMFGGSLAYGAGGGTNDTWELIAVDVPLINEHPASQFRLAGETATFSVQVAQPTSVAYQWYRGDTPIPGARTPTFTIPEVRPENAGEYSVLVSNLCGAKRSLPAILTLNPRLQIFSSANRAILIWRPDSAVVLETADNVNGPWTAISDPPNPFTLGGVEPAKFFRHRRTE